MSTENTIPKQNQLAEAALILTNEDSLNMNIMRETYNKFNSITYSTAELNKFKDNILSLLKERDKFFLDKLSEYKTSTDKIKFDFNSENKLSNSKFSKIIDTQAKMTSRLDQLSDYENFVTKTNDKLVSHDIRLTNIRNDFSLATQKYDKIYLDNLELPGYIGRCAKYKNCQSFFLDVIKDLAKLNIYREKNIIDLKMYKDKLETIISSMNSILDNNNQSQMKYINDMKEKILNDCKSMFETVTDSMKDIRVENSKYTVDLISTSMNLSKKWEKLEKIKEELLEKFNYDVNKYQMLTDDTIKSFEEFKNEYGVIRRKFMELAEFIKDIRFRKNIGGNVKKKEVKQMVKKMLKKRKSFEGENVQLLSDITNIENIDYKKYYNIESNDEGEINNSSNIIYTNNNRSKSLKPKNKKNFNNNNIKEKEKEKEKLNEKINQKNNSNKLVKEIKQKKEMNQSVEDTHIPRINMNNSSLNKNNNTIDKEKDKNKSSRSVNINMKLNISNINNKKNNFNNIINSDEKNIKNNLVIDSKNLKDEENLEEKKDKEMNKNKDSNIIKLVKNNTNNNIELRNILDGNNKYIEKKENVTISYSHRDKPQEKNIEKENSNINNSNINKTNIINYEINPIKLNNDTKRSMIEDVSTISDVKNTSSSVNKDNKFSSEKSVSFISDSNGNNINKFIINDIHLEQNDKIIKELASELEQSTAKKDKFEQKFKTACNNIEPINLLSNNKTSNEKNSQIQNQYQYQTNNINQINKQLSPSNSAEIVCDDNNNLNKNENNVNSNNIIKDNNNIIKDNNNNVIINSNSNCNSNSNNNTNNINMKTPSNENETTNNNIKQNNNDDVNNSNINSNIISSNNMVRNESISNLNPIKINNEIHLNEVISSNSVNSKLHAFDQKLLNLELYTKEKIIEIISQINSLKQNGNGNNFERNSINNIELNRTSFVPNITPSSTEKNKTFNNSFMSTQNNKITHHSSFNLEKAYVSDNNQININNENNKNILNINNNINNNSPNQNLLYNNNNFNLDKKKYSLRNVNPKQSLINSKIQKKNSFSYNVNTNNAIKKNIPSNFLTENNNNNNYNNSVINNNILINNNNSNNLFQKNNLNNLNNPIKQNNSKEIIESTGPKIIQSISNDINTKFLKEIEKKIENNNNILKMNNMDDLYNKKLNKNINNFNQNRNNYNDSSFNGAEIKLVDLNKLVNHQLPRNRLVPIHINENEFFDHFKNTK